MNATPNVTSTQRTTDESLATIRRIARSGVLALRNVVAVVRAELARDRSESR